MHRSHLACLLTALVLAACGGGQSPAGTTPGAGTSGGNTTTAVIVGPGTDPHAQINAVAATDTGAVTDCPPAGPPRRLTRRQLINALADLTTQLSGDSTLAGGVASLVIDSAQFPPDTLVNPDSSRHKGYERLDSGLTSRQVGALKTVAETLAGTITADSARVTRLLDNCSSDADTCMLAFARKAGRLFFRMPLSDAEADIYRRAAGGSMAPAAVAKVLATMIASPSFFLVIERGQSVASGTSCVPLTAHELATRLSLQFWDTVPDSTLAAAADNGTLLDPAVAAAQVRRLLADPRADAALRNFFSQWFRLQELVAMDGRVGNAKFDAFAGSFHALPTTRDAAINEVLDMVSYVAARNGSLQQLLTDRHSFARSSDIAALYNTPVWDGVSAPPLFGETSRVGLLTRIGIIANGAADTTLPIQRGVRVLSALTCQTMPPPAMNQSNAKADLSGVLTTRQRTERVTQMAGTSCINCHQPLINPWGFVFEGFDALGRVRSTEVVLDDNGNKLGEKPLDTAAVATLAGLNAHAIATPAEAQQMVLDSGNFDRCFARNYVRYSFGRADTAADAGLVEVLRQQAASGANIKSLLAFIAQRKEFTTIAKVTQ